MVLGMSPAAVCQCFTLVSMCTSIADPNWIDVSYSNSSQPGGAKRVIYGVAFTLRASQNLTNTAPLGGLNGWGMWLLYGLAALCYTTVLFSSSSLLMDFLGGAYSRPRLLGTLYVITAAVIVSVLAVCVACLYVIRHNLHQGAEARRWGSLAAIALPSGGTLGATAEPPVVSAVQMGPGDSFWISATGLLFSCLAVVVHLTGSCGGAGASSSSSSSSSSASDQGAAGPYSSATRGRMGGRQEDTEPLIIHGQEGGGPGDT